MDREIRRKLTIPQKIERACAEQRGRATQSYGQASDIIARALAFWKTGDPIRALELAEREAANHPDHPDLQCLLGRAYLQLPVPRGREADVALRKAYTLKCGRSELIPLWIAAKKSLQDWIGLREITKDLFQLRNANCVLAFAEAQIELGNLSSQNGRYFDAERFFRDGIDAIENGLSNGTAKARYTEICQVNIALLERWYRASVREWRGKSRDQFYLWKTCLECWTRGHQTTDVLRSSIETLKGWWKSVELSSTADPAAGRLLSEALDQISRWRIPDHWIEDQRAMGTFLRRYGR